MPDSTWIQSGSPQTPDKTAKILAWIKAHRDAVVGALVISAGAALLGLWVAFHYSGVRETAWKNLFIAQQTGLSGNLAEASKQLDAIETNYPGTSAWGFAALGKGDLLFRQGKFAEAADEYAKVVSKGRKDLAPFALYNQGRAKEAAADLAGAQGLYKDFLSLYPGHFLAPEAHLSLASALETAGNPAEAKAAYEKIVLLYPETSWAAAAKARLMPEPPPAQAAGKTPPSPAPEKKI